MSDDKVQVSKSLLRRVKGEVVELRERVAELEMQLDEKSAEARAYAIALEKANSREDPAGEGEVVGLEAALVEAEDALVEAEADRAEALEDLKACRSTSDGLRREVEGLRRELATATAERDRVATEASGRVSELDEEVRGVRRERDRLLNTHPAPPTELGGRHREAVDSIGEAFGAWCRRGSPLVSRPYLFAAFLSNALGVAATVTPVFRDRGATSPTFKESPADGVEHWLVTAGPDRVLLPQPLSPTQFRELAPVFTGRSTPAELRQIEPASVEGGPAGFRLSSAGNVKPGGR